MAYTLKLQKGDKVIVKMGSKLCLCTTMKQEDRNKWHIGIIKAIGFNGLMVIELQNYQFSIDKFNDNKSDILVEHASPDPIWNDAIVIKKVS